jgi:hypothetical protein
VGVLAIVIIAVSMVVAGVSFALASPYFLDISAQFSNHAPSNLAAGLPLSSNELPVSFGNVTNLTENSQDSVYGQVAASGDNMYVVWQDSVVPSSENGGGRNYDIFVKKSSDGGETFEESLNLSANPGFSNHPQISAYNDNVYVVWVDDTSGNGEVLFAKSDDNGSTFGDATSLTDDPSDSFHPELAVSGSNVYVVWLDEDNEGSRIMFMASADGGETFGRAMVISDRANSASLAKVAAYGESAYITWNLVDVEMENGLFFVKSSDGGETFGDIIKLNRQDNFGEPQIVAYNDTVQVVSGGLESVEVNSLFFAKSTDRGETFASSEVDGNDMFVKPLNVEPVVDGNAATNMLLYVAGQVYVSGNQEIPRNQEILLLALDGSSGDEGALKPIGMVNLSNNKGRSECPSIAISGDNIYVVWEDLTPGNHEILYTKGTRIL